MKKIISLLTLGLLVAAFIGGYFYARIENPPSPARLSLEQILSIRELHLVKHTYTDLFFLHKNNKPNKAIRAIVQVPVTITAYLNLKDIQLIHQGDTVRQVILPRAVLNEPFYHVDRMTVRKTRALQWHIGKDLYPHVSSYLASLVAGRMDTARQIAVANRILLQAEAEGKEYIESLLVSLGHTDVRVTFGDETKDQEVVTYLQTHQRKTVPVLHRAVAQAEAVPFEFLPWR